MDQFEGTGSNQAEPRPMELLNAVYSLPDPAAEATEEEQATRAVFQDRVLGVLTQARYLGELLEGLFGDVEMPFSVKQKLIAELDYMARLKLMRQSGDYYKPVPPVIEADPLDVMLKGQFESSPKRGTKRKASGKKARHQHAGSHQRDKRRRRFPH